MRRYAVGFVVGILVSLILIWDITSAAVRLDSEGIACVGAQRVLEGEIPYRDFWTLYAPGSYYALAGLFAVFGSHLLVARMAAVAMMIASVLLVYAIVRRWNRHLIAVPATLVTAVVLNPAGRYFGTYPPALFCCLAAIFASMQYFQTGSRKWIFLAGVACSCAVVFKHDVGGYLALAVLLTLLVSRSSPTDSPSDRLSLASELRGFLVGCTLPALPVYATLLFASGADLWRDLIYFPFTDFPASRPEHYPGAIPDWSKFTSWGRSVEEISHRLRFTCPVLLFLGSTIWLALRYRTLRSVRRTTQLLLTACLPFFWLAAHVQINTHIYTMTVLCVLLLCLVLPDVVHSTKTPGRIAFLSLVAVCLAAWLPKPAYAMLRPLIQSEPVSMLSSPRAGAMSTIEARCADGDAAVAYVRELTDACDSVYVGLHRHDVVIVSSPLLYFLLNRPIPTRYHELHPAIADTDTVQREIVAELSHADVRYAILYAPFSDEFLDDVQRRRCDRLPQTGADRLDAFIRNHFERVARFGRFAVWRRVRFSDEDALSATIP